MKRWFKMEQPLLLIAFYFHPKYRKLAVNMHLSEADVSGFLKQYSQRWSSADAYDFEGGFAINFSEVASGWAIETAS